MKIKHLLLAAVAVVAGMTSCSKDSAGVDGDGEFDFYMQITKDDLVNSRAETPDRVENGQEVAFNEGAVLFTDATGNNVYRYVRVSSSYGSADVSPTELEDGYLFKGISNLATHVHVIGNYDFSSISNVADLAQLDTYTKTLKEVTDAKYGVSNATLYGSQILTDVVIGSGSKGEQLGADREAKVELAPILARFEIEKISSSDLKAEFKLEGIYIDNFYYSSSIVGTLDQSKVIPYVLETSYAEYSRSTGYSTADWYPILFDDGGPTSPGLGTSTTSSPYTLQPGTANAVWAYNFYPAADMVPNIILHLSNVTVDDGASGSKLRPNDTLDNIPGNNPGDNDGVAYLTVTGYRATPSNGGGSVAFAGGYVYIIKDMEFSADDLRDEPKGPEDPDNPGPGDEKYEVLVEVELMNWTTEEIIVEYN
ncbi:MAG: hypothetical protein LUF87_03110 [Alistipes sp.]|nr:hypothetical protein [Alistipes sp.]